MTIVLSKMMGSAFRQVRLYMLMTICHFYAARNSGSIWSQGLQCLMETTTQKDMRKLYNCPRGKEIIAHAQAGGQAYCLILTCPEWFGRCEEVTLAPSYISSEFSKSFWWLIKQNMVWGLSIYLSSCLPLYGPKHCLTSSKAVLLAVPKQTKRK